jgi:hypothetical protein
MAYTWFFLAMTHHRLGHADESRRWLDRATQATDETLKPPPETPEKSIGPTGIIRPPWNRKLMLRLLRGEAEALIGRADNKTRHKETKDTEKKP